MAKNNFKLTGKKFILYIVAIPIIIALLLGFSFQSYHFIPDSVEKQFGDDVYKVIIDQKDLIQNTYINNFINKMMDKIDPGTRYHVSLIKNPSTKALSLPGNHIILFTGLINQLESIDELASILIHEITHLKKHHILQVLLRTIGMKYSLNLIFKDYYFPKAFQKKKNLSFLFQYTPGFIKKADEQAVKRLIEISYNPNALLNLLQRYYNKSKSFGNLNQNKDNTDKYNAVPLWMSFKYLLNQRIANLKKKFNLRDHLPHAKPDKQWKEFLSHLKY